MSLWNQSLDTATAAKQLTHRYRQVITHKHSPRAAQTAQTFVNLYLLYLNEDILYVIHFELPFSTVFMILTI